MLLLFSGTMIVENGQVISSVPARHKNSPSYFHSFGLTKDFVVFIEQPLYVADEDGRKGIIGTANLKWKKTDMVREDFGCPKARPAQ